MPTTKLVLTVPTNMVKEPITSRLVRDHNLMVNILRAQISPDEVGHMVVEIEGDREAIESGRRYLASVNVKIQSLDQDVRWSADLCTHCTACTTVCPTGALSVDRKNMQVSFAIDKCIGCELCIPVCAYRAMEVHV
jgi:ferredoxin